MTGAQLTDGLIVGQLPAVGDAGEQLGLVLEKDSALTSCTTAAVDALRADGTLAALAAEWIADGGGQQQRVAIVRELINKPVLMLFDEVTSALDPELVGEVLAMISDLKSDGMTMLVATHEMGFARQVSDAVVFLSEGSVAESGPPEQVLGDPPDSRTQQFLRRIITSGRLRAPDAPPSATANSS